MQTAHEQARRMAITCAAAFVGLNLVFYVLSASYFEGHRAAADAAGALVTSSPERLTQARIAFAVFAAITGVVGFAAWMKPRALGHLLPAVFGMLYIALSVRVVFITSQPAVLPVFLLVSGGLLLALSWSSRFRAVRASWAFLVAMCAVFAVFELFIGMKLARQFDVSLWLLLVAPGLKVIAAAALVSLNRDYIDADGRLAPA